MSIYELVLKKCIDNYIDKCIDTNFNQCIHLLYRQMYRQNHE